MTGTEDRIPKGSVPPGPWCFPFDGAGGLNFLFLHLKMEQQPPTV